MLSRAEERTERKGPHINGEDIYCRAAAAMFGYCLPPAGLPASPGILEEGVVISPFDLLTPPGCQADEGAAQRVFGEVAGHQTRMDADDQEARS